ncbi:MAG: hypothetical protein A2Y61_06175 [Chloroflexi bacterium RBG_13_60_13]|nr:MAG: hypothetical protein A2Y61_06175 [Chloroflexi bacterium RBG_13_60_13]
MHNLKRDSRGVPLFLPIRFDRHPLSFILILSDGLQEYLRWEGTSIVGATKFCCFPSIKLTQQDENFELEVGFFLTGTPEEEEYLKRQAQAAAAIAGEPGQADLSLNSAASLLLDGLRRELDSQIDLGAAFRLVLTISNPKGLVVRKAG